VRVGVGDRGREGLDGEGGAEPAQHAARGQADTGVGVVAQRVGQHGHGVRPGRTVEGLVLDAAETDGVVFGEHHLDQRADALLTEIDQGRSGRAHELRPAAALARGVDERLLQPGDVTDGRQVLDPARAREQRHPALLLHAQDRAGRRPAAEDFGPPRRAFGPRSATTREVG
jgi:hypothetical protein